MGHSMTFWLGLVLTSMHHSIRVDFQYSCKDWSVVAIPYSFHMNRQATFVIACLESQL